ncbi:MAG: arginase family protein, partial [archaeon]
MQIIKVPGFASEKTKGCKNTGNALLKNLKDFKFNEEGKSTEGVFLNLEEIHVNNASPSTKDSLIYDNALEAFDAQDRVIFLGGDHSITLPLAKAFLFHCKLETKAPCLIVFDACADCIDENNKEKDKSWLKELILSDFPPENILLVGTRHFSKDEKDFLRNQRVKMISIGSFLEDINSACDSVMEFSSGKILYISFDFKSLDPVFMPSVSEIFPGGFSSRQIIYLIQRLKKIKNLKVIDLVELDSE